MRILTWTWYAAIAILATLPVASQPYRIVGSTRCAMCHRAGTAGNIYARWKSGPHASAFLTLQSEKARSLSEGKPFRNPECLGCHTTAGALNRTVGVEPGTREGVGCEACHGAGSGYSRLAIMQDRRKATAKGLIAGADKRCETCHNGTCPTDASGSYRDEWRRFGHGKNLITKGDKR